MSNVMIVRVKPDPHNRPGTSEVWYRDYNVRGGVEVFYLWSDHWNREYPDVSIPEIGFDCEPMPPSRPPCVPYALSSPEAFAATTGRIVIYEKG